MVRILLVDEQPMVRRGLRQVIGEQKTLEVAGETGSLEEALEALKNLQPDLAVLEMALEGGRGLDFLTAAGKLAPRLKTLVFTTLDDGRSLHQALAAGAAGYLLKRADETELLLALLAVSRGENYIDPFMTRSILQGVTGREAAPRKEDLELSGRQKEILKMIARGYTDRQIAERLFISVKTVESNKARIKEKLNISQRAELVQYALDHYF